jgi:hypothetical protein
MWTNLDPRRVANTSVFLYAPHVDEAGLGAYINSNGLDEYRRYLDDQ